MERRIAPRAKIRRRRCLLDIVCLSSLMRSVDAFGLSQTTAVSFAASRLESSSTAIYGANQGLYNQRDGGRGVGGKSKRQERVGQLVQTELSQILHTGVIKGNDVEYLDAALRCRISVVRADVSPDLRQARISISVRPTQQPVTPTVDDTDNDDDTVSSGLGSSNVVAGTTIDEPPSAAATTTNDDDRRFAQAWLVRNSNAIRHTVAQRMSHIKSSCPALTFVPVDITAAVDVMHLIDQVSAGSDKRGGRMQWDPEEMARLMMGGGDDDDDEEDETEYEGEVDDDDWEETDVDFFKTKK